VLRDDAADAVPVTGPVRLLAVNHTSVYGGAEQNLCDLLQRLPPEQVEVLGVVAPGTGPLTARLTGLGIRSFDLPVPHLAGVRNPLPFLRGVVQWAGFARRLGRLLAGLEPDVVYASSAHAAIAAEPALSRARYPWFWQMPDLVRPTAFNRLALRRALHRADRIVAISEATAASLRALGAAPARIDLVYCAVDAAAFRRSPAAAAEVRRELGIPSGAPVVGMFGQITRWKGWHVLVAALPAFVAAHPDVHCLLVGRPTRPLDEPYAEELKRNVAKAGLEQAVRWTGFRPDVARLMSACDIVVHASVEPEPLGVVIMEAMAAGAAVICTRGGGTEEMVTDGVTGLVVAPEDPAALGAAVLGLLAAPERRLRMAELAAAEAARRFTHEARVAQFGRLIRAAADRSGR
jgi:glycosyltransferase involved in cell wall biosynthesis